MLDTSYIFYWDAPPVNGGIIQQILQIGQFGQKRISHSVITNGSGWRRVYYQMEGDF